MSADYMSEYVNPSSADLAESLKQAGGWTAEDMESPDRHAPRLLHTAERQHEIREARMAGSPSPAPGDGKPSFNAIQQACKMDKHIRFETCQGIGNTDWHGDRTLCTQDGRFHPGTSNSFLYLYN